MKRSLLTLVLPLTLATTAICADEIPSLSYEHRIGFSPSFTELGASIGYEHIKADSFYLGITSTFVKNGSLNILSAGYNFLLTPKDKFTPALGIGAIKIKGYSGLEYLPIFGLEYAHQFDNRFAVGISLSSVLRHNFNIAIGLPFTIYLGQNRDWDIRLIPVYSRVESTYHHHEKLSLAYSVGKSF